MESIFQKNDEKCKIELHHAKAKVEWREHLSLVGKWLEVCLATKSYWPQTTTQMTYIFCEQLDILDCDQWWQKY